jgi:hypothetical protein
MSASKIRRSRRLVAKEDPFYITATTKASRVTEVQLDLSTASDCMRAALEASEVLHHPCRLESPPPSFVRAGVQPCSPIQEG